MADQDPLQRALISDHALLDDRALLDCDTALQLTERETRLLAAALQQRIDAQHERELS